MCFFGLLAPSPGNLPGSAAARCTRHLMPGILDRMACGVALALAIRGRAKCRRPPRGKNKTSQIPSKIALGMGWFGARGGSPIKLNTSRQLVFSDFLIVSDVAFFCVKIWARAKNTVKTIKKSRSGRVLSSKNCHVFDLVKILRFKMWKGVGGYPPLCFGRLQKPKIALKQYFSGKNHCAKTL